MSDPDKDKDSLRHFFETQLWLAGALVTAVALNLGLIAFFFSATLRLCTPPWKVYPPVKSVPPVKNNLTPIPLFTPKPFPTR